MTKDDLQRTLFMNTLKTRILAVVFELADDTNYTKTDAIEDLLKTVAMIDETGETEVVLPEKASKKLAVLKVIISQS